MRIYTQKIDTPDGPSKALIIEVTKDSVITMKFSRDRALRLSDALLPDGEDVDFKGEKAHE